MESTAAKVIKIHMRLIMLFESHLEGKKCQAYSDYLLHLNPADDEEGFEPDLLVICDPSKNKGTYCEGAPDLIIEILSPSTSKRDRFYKRNRYFAAGVREYWIIDPVRETVVVYDWREGDCVPIAYTWRSTIKVSILDDFSIDFNRVFPTLP
ncbi:hypothetical protein AGMMS49992_07880 [Clostridia bacterium]|nr:hypothetical protein AGMMS49992_07880 [Clostridia bacterium]